MVAYTEYDSAKPDGATSPTTFSADDLANQRALRDMVIGGRVKGFIQSRTTGTGPGVDRPQFITWLNATLSIGFRMNLTWSGFTITSCLWQWTSAADYPGTWTDMGVAQANTIDGSNNYTATTNSGGIATLIFEIWTKCLKVVSDLATHIAATGAAVHGLASMAIQAASAVAITGGSANGMKFGDVTPADVDATRVREKFNDYGAIAAGGTVTLELDKYSHFAFTPHATTANTVIIATSGTPASGKTQGFTLEIINGQRSADGKITYPANTKWIGGAAARPLDTALELAGRNFYTIVTRDGGARLEFQHVGKGG